MPLQFGKIVEQRGRHPTFLLHHGFDHPRARKLYSVDDGSRVLPVGCKPFGCVRRGFAGFEPRSRVGRRAEGADNFNVGLRDELADLQFAFDEHRQRWSLHSSDGKSLALRDRIRPRQIHSNQPIGLSTTAGCRSQRVIRAPVLHRQKPGLDRAGRKR